MKIFVLILIALVSTYATAKVEDPVSNAALFVDGFLRGALAKEIGRVDDCLTDGDKIINDVDTLLKDCEGKFDLLDIITDIGSLLVDIPKSIKDCENLPDTVEDTFKRWEKTIKDPIKIAKIVYKALSDYKDQLKDDAQTFVSEWKADHYENSGEKLGDIPHILFDECSNEDAPFKAVKTLIEQE
mgnify:CR=1 FL=1